MDQDAVIVGASAPSPDGDKVRLLEGRYIELLEKRIATLEELLKDKKGGKKAPNAELTSNDRVQQYLNGESPERQRGESVSLVEDGSQRAPKIQFRELKYNKEGVGIVKDVSDKEPHKTEELIKPKDSPDLTWLRTFDKSNKYSHSEVGVISDELRDLFRGEFAHDPRMHFSNESNKNDITITSPFEPLIHNWTRLEAVASGEIEATIWKTGKLHNGVDRPIPMAPSDERLTKARTDLNALLTQIRSTPELTSYFSGLEAQNKSHAVQFNHLWTIFPPGELVYSTLFMNQPQIFVVKESSSYIHSESDSGREKDQKRTWYLVCWTYDWDGNTLNRAPIQFKFEEYQGSRMINTMHCHPLRFHSTGEDAEAEIQKLQQDMIERGKRYRELSLKTTGAQMFDYEGDTVSHGTGFQRLRNSQQGANNNALTDLVLRIYGRRQTTSTTKQTERRHMRGRVMVDFESYLQHAPEVRKYGPMGDGTFSARDDECRCGVCLSNEALASNQKRRWDGFTAKDRFVDEQFLICPPRVLGYHLESRTWLELDVTKVHDIHRPESNVAFQKLQLAKAHKELIQSLVQSHTSGTGKKPLMEDIVKEKGKGLVILLHGPPGVGKTLTAESVAQMAGRPLFSVSASDIGLDPADVEHNLEALFELAARWRAVLLFDEADVFLESRSSHTSDLTRNALVSVLLRVLEYYSGILILTTNRIQQFDVAVQSRVNLGIRYRDLTMDQKKKIIENFIQQLGDDNVEDKEELLENLYEDTDVVDWFELLNGRQVRNVLFSAASLAMKDGGTLQIKHIKTMLKATWSFQDSIKTIVASARQKAEVGITPMS